MKKLKKRILKRAKSIRRPRKPAVSSKHTKIRLGSFMGILAILAARKWRRSRRPARALINKQGVGPAHTKGVPKAEERGMKYGHVEDGHAAGRPIGSISPA